MERKIGEIFEYNGEWYQCVESSGCALCAFNETDCNDIDTGSCEVNSRSDGKSVVFKNLKKIGKPVTVKGRTFQKLTSDNNSCKECVFNVPNKACCKNSYIEGICGDNGFWIEIKQNKEDMEENNNAKHSNSESIGKNLKPFDLQKAREGKPVCTMDGRKVRIICFDSNGGRPIVALVTECDDEEEIPYKYHCDGSYNCQSIQSDNDLMMLPEKKEGWVNVSKYSVFASKEEALSHKTYDIIDTIKVSWEE